MAVLLQQPIGLLVSNGICTTVLNKQTSSVYKRHIGLDEVNRPRIVVRSIVITFELIFELFLMKNIKLKELNNCMYNCKIDKVYVTSKLSPTLRVRNIVKVRCGQHLVDNIEEMGDNDDNI